VRKAYGGQFLVRASPPTVDLDAMRPVLDDDFAADNIRANDDLRDIGALAPPIGYAMALLAGQDHLRMLHGNWVSMT